MKVYFSHKTKNTMIVVLLSLCLQQFGKEKKTKQYCLLQYKLQEVKVRLC